MFIYNINIFKHINPIYGPLNDYHHLYSITEHSNYIRTYELVLVSLRRKAPKALKPVSRGMVPRGMNENLAEHFVYWIHRL